MVSFSLLLDFTFHSSRIWLNVSGPDSILGPNPPGRTHRSFSGLDNVFLSEPCFEPFCSGWILGAERIRGIMDGVVFPIFDSDLADFRVELLGSVA